MVVFATTLKCNQLPLNYDVNTYKYSKDSVFVVFSFSFPQDAVNYKKVDDNFLSDLQLQLEMNNQTDSVQKIWDINYSTKTIEEKKGKIFIGSKQFIVKQGKYGIKIYFKDNNDIKNSVLLESNINIPAIDNEKLQLSNIEIAYSIDKISNIQNGVNPDFSKNDLYFIPNPSNEIAGVDPELKIYYEIYNYDNSKYDSLQINYYILNSMKAKMASYTKIKRNIPSAFYDINQFVLDTLPSGLYYLNIKAEAYKSGEKIVSTETDKKFYLMNPQRSPKLTTYFSEDEQYAHSEFASMSDEQCELEHKQIIWIASGGEKEVWEKLHDINAKKKFLYAFWNNRKKDRSTINNPEREEFKKLIDYTNTYYSYGKEDNGWKSDRGRVVLKYGKPTNVDVLPAQDGNKPYEIWYYDALSGGVKFFFVDVRLNGIYVLVHSTLFDEVQNSDWKTRFLENNK